MNKFLTIWPTTGDKAIIVNSVHIVDVIPLAGRDGCEIHLSNGRNIQTWVKFDVFIDKLNPISLT